MTVSLDKVWTVAVYRIDQEYGGPEEGGWYYQTEDLVCDEGPFTSEDSAYDRAEVLRTTEFQDNKYRYSVHPKGDDYWVRVTQGPADQLTEHYPEERPHYE